MSRRLGNDRVMELAKDSSQWASEQGIKDTAEAIAYMAEKGYFDPNIESNVYPAAQQDMVDQRERCNVHQRHLAAERSC